MNNTIPNVPRDHELELKQALLLHDERALLSTPSPAGVDGLEVVAWRIGFPNNAGYKVYEQRQPWAYEQYGVPSAIVYEVQELCRLSDAQAILDGLRGEVATLTAESELGLGHYVNMQKERDQHAQRIGALEKEVASSERELERMLVMSLRLVSMKSSNDNFARLLKQSRQYVAYAFSEGMDGAFTLGLDIDAALSAGKGSDQ